MIRKIKAEDKEIYIKMAHDFYRMPAVDHPVPDSYLEKTFEECLKSDTYAELFILEWEGKIAGYGLIAKTFSQEAGGMVYWLEELYILEEYRSKGLGSEYFRYMEEQKEEGVTRFRLEVEKENERAWKLYKRQDQGESDRDSDGSHRCDPDGAEGWLSGNCIPPVRRDRGSVYCRPCGGI